MVTVLLAVRTCRSPSKGNVSVLGQFSFSYLLANSLTCCPCKIPTGQSGADLLVFLISNSQHPEIRKYWRKLPKATHKQKVSDEQHNEHADREKVRVQKVKDILRTHRDCETGKKIKLPEQDYIQCVQPDARAGIRPSPLPVLILTFLHPTRQVDGQHPRHARYGLVLRRPLVAAERRGLRPDWLGDVPYCGRPASPSEGLGEFYSSCSHRRLHPLTRICDGPALQTYCGDMHVYVAPPLFNKQDGATIAEPYLTTRQIPTEAAQEVLEFLRPKNERNYLRRAAAG